MSISHRYRNFGRTNPSAQNSEDPALEAIEDEKLQSFDAGYKAGWDDALKAQAEAKTSVAAELSQNLLDMSFSYHEALSKVTNSMEPMMQQIIRKLLPEVVSSALSAHIMEQLKAIVDERANLPVEIVVAECNVATVKELAGGSLVKPFAVVADSALGEGQAFIRFGDVEREVDLNSVVVGVSDAMQAFFHETQKEPADE